MIDLAPAHLATVRRLLAAHTPECEVRAFGSRVTWTAKDHSDLDLALIGPEKLAPARLRHLREAFEESNLPMRVDLLDWHTISEKFKNVILKRFEVVQWPKLVALSGRSHSPQTRWRSIVLGDLVWIKHGYAFSGENIREEPPGDILVTPGNFAVGGGFKNDKFKYFDGPVTDDYILHEGDLIVTMTDLSKQADTLGYPALVPALKGSRFLHNQRIGKILIRPGAELDKRFLFYLLRTAEYRDEILASATGTTVKHTSPSRILAYKAPIPPLAEQKTIAQILGALDDKIELNQRMNSTLEAMARAFFQSWFVDFDPVRAKLDNRKPAGLDAATAAIFPGHFEHGEHGLRPIGWRDAAIEEVCAINAWTLGKNDNLETLEYVEISKVTRGNIANITVYARGEEPSRARRRLRHGDIVLSTVRRDRGSYFLALNPPENRLASTGFAVLTPTKVPWSFIHAAMTQPEVSEHLGQMADGGAYPAVRPEIIGAMKVTLPDDREVIDAFHHTCAPLFERAETNRAESRTLATLRDTLLPKLLTGEIRPAN